MRYGYYVQDERDLTKESKLSSYSDTEDKCQSVQTRKVSYNKEEEAKGISYISKSSAEKDNKTLLPTSSKVSTENKTSLPTGSQTPTAATYAVSKLKEGLDAVVENIKSKPVEEEETSKVMAAVLGAVCLLLSIGIVIPVSMLPVMAITSVLGLFQQSGNDFKDINQSVQIEEVVYDEDESDD